MSRGKYRRIGHKGADALVPGNTLESFEAAVEVGVDMIEMDVLRGREGRLVIAHDHQEARTRRPLQLTEALDAFLEPPLDQVEIDCDLKLPGREAELAGTLAGHGLLDRVMVSTMEIESLIKLRTLEPDLRLGWTYPKTSRDWTRDRWAAPAVAAGLLALRRRFPKTVRRRAPELGVDAVWAYQRLITPRLVAAAQDAGVELIAWTADDPARIAQLAEMGVSGICSNDPRLFDAAAETPAPPPPADGAAPPEEAEAAVEELREDGEPRDEAKPAKRAEPAKEAAPAKDGDDRRKAPRSGAKGGRERHARQRARKR
jgi:glycerophosphoryl diester phosphodiesterase